MEKRKNGRFWFENFRTLVIQRQGARCAICGKICTDEDTQIDHIKPLHKGGTNELDNLQLLCVSCHEQKTANECKANYISKDNLLKNLIKK